MSFSPLSGSVLAKCGSTLLCYLRAAPLWLFVILVLVGGALRQRLVPRGPPPPRPDKKS